MTNDNLALWESVRTPDPKHTKQFTRAGGFSGTAISPIYLIRRATELWGEMGKNWGAKEIETRLESGIWMSKVALWYPNCQQPVEQWGGTQFQVTKKDGTLYFDDEAPKKSYTDALSKCLSWLGFAADIHMGLFDDVKYVNDARKRFEAEESPKETATDANERTTIVWEAMDASDTFDDFWGVMVLHRPWIDTLKSQGDGVSDEMNKRITNAAKRSTADLIHQITKLKTSEEVTAWARTNSGRLTKLKTIDEKLHGDVVAAGAKQKEAVKQPTSED